MNTVSGILKGECWSPEAMSDRAYSQLAQGYADCSKVEIAWHIADPSFLVIQILGHFGSAALSPRS